MRKWGTVMLLLIGSFVLLLVISGQYTVTDNDRNIDSSRSTPSLKNTEIDINRNDTHDGSLKNRQGKDVINKLKILRKKASENAPHQPPLPEESSGLVMSDGERRVIKEANKRYFDEMPLYLEKEWQDSTDDDIWTGRTQETIENLMKKYVSNDTTFENVECKEIICKASFLTKDRESLAEFRTIWRRYGPRKEQDLGKWEKRSQDELLVTVFFSKEGDKRAFRNSREKLFRNVRSELDLDEAPVYW